VAAGQLRLRERPLAVLRGGAPVLGQAQAARPIPRALEKLQLDPELARSVRHPVDLLGLERGLRGGEAVGLKELPVAGIEQGQHDVSRPLVSHHVDVVARLNGHPQGWRSLADGLLPTAAAEDKEQERQK
jgi:hypothetical protein